MVASSILDFFDKHILEIKVAIFVASSKLGLFDKHVRKIKVVIFVSSSKLGLLDKDVLKIKVVIFTKTQAYWQCIPLVSEECFSVGTRCQLEDTHVITTKRSHADGLVMCLEGTPATSL